MVQLVVYVGKVYNVHCTNCILYIVHFTQYSLYSVLYTHCTVYTLPSIHCTAYSIHTVQCTLYLIFTVQRTLCTLYIVHYTQCTIHCTLYRGIVYLYLSPTIYIYTTCTHSIIIIIIVIIVIINSIGIINIINIIFVCGAKITLFTLVCRILSSRFGEQRRRHASLHPCKTPSTLPPPPPHTTQALRILKHTPIRCFSYGYFSDPSYSNTPSPSCHILCCSSLSLLHLYCECFPESFI